MLFSSISFLYYFLPVVLILYGLAPRRMKNTVLLLSSLFFYGWGEPKYIFLMIATIFSSYVLALFIESTLGTTRAKFYLLLSVLSSLLPLFYFKYADFFIINFNRMSKLPLPLLNVLLPVGISFYTFQILSYSVDVYRGEVPAQRNVILLATYVTLFPQLVAGPIVRYTDIEKSLRERRHSYNDAATGIRRFLIGLAKKILIANQLGELCDLFRATGDPSVLYYWLYAIAFCLHIYFDFSAYSDMAIGLGKIFGFHFKENFNYPYVARSATEFWRRWHMSLGSWFRDYVYIPLGGNRVGKWRALSNIVIVWMLTGFWHGAAWTFIAWGFYFAIILVLEKLFLLERLNKHKIISHVYTFLVISISMVIFNSTDLSEAMLYIGRMFGLRHLPLISDEFIYYLRSYSRVLIIAVLGATPLLKKTIEKLKEKREYLQLINLAEPLLLLLILLLITAYLIDGSFNPFLYFRF